MLLIWFSERPRWKTTGSRPKAFFLKLVMLFWKRKVKILFWKKESESVVLEKGSESKFKVVILFWNRKVFERNYEFLEEKKIIQKYLIKI